MAKVWRKNDLEWRAMHPGVEVARLHRHVEGGGAAVFRMAAGAVLPRHDHPVGEHTFVVEGRLSFGELQLGAGDCMWVEPSEQHEVRALADSVFFGVAPPKVERY